MYAGAGGAAGAGGGAMSLRMDRSELKCKSGCDYFGNPQWKGYCSKCHREQMQRQRRIEKRESGTVGTLPKPESRGQEKTQKLSSHSSFSKFEEKRHKQTETLKKTNILKFNMFRKSNEDQSKEPPDFKIPSSILEAQKRDFAKQFPRLSQTVSRDTRKFVHTFIMDVIKCLHVKTMDDLSERIQCLYQIYVRRIDTNQLYSEVDADTKELLVDFVEKHAMSYLHSYVFSPGNTEDERLDARMHARIRQLGWVCPSHLECRVDQRQPRCRELLYDAINELISMDGLVSPGGKLACVRRCCMCVVELVSAAAGAPASADELLPALIFTVLKANPPRLVSNINFVTRFINANRLMTGEGGYYFTNLCCAVSFIENLTADSLSMAQQEFDCYMSMPATIGGSSWAMALSLCDGLREAGKQRDRMSGLEERANRVEEGSREMGENIRSFKDEIMKKVSSVLARTPLELKPRRPLPSLGKFVRGNIGHLADVLASNQGTVTEPKEKEYGSADLVDALASNEAAVAATTEEYNKHSVDVLTNLIAPEELIKEEIRDNIDLLVELPEESKEKTFDDMDSAKILLENADESSTRSPQLLDQSLKQTSSIELLTPSPIFGFTSFDTRSIDELMTPDEFGNDQLVPGLTNVNYDIDLSDFSAENSAADDLPKEPKDPFSPEGIGNFDPFGPHMLGNETMNPQVVAFKPQILQNLQMDLQIVPKEPSKPQTLRNAQFGMQLGSLNPLVVQKECNLQKPHDPFWPQTLQNAPFNPQTLKSDPFGMNSLQNEHLNLQLAHKDPFIQQNIPQNDPFSPPGLSSQDSLAPLSVQHSYDPFDPIKQYSAKDSFSPDPFGSQSFNIGLVKDPFSPANTAFIPNQSSNTLKNVSDNETVSILDNTESPTSACLLPSPLLPLNKSN